MKQTNQPGAPWDNRTVTVSDMLAAINAVEAAQNKRLAAVATSLASLKTRLYPKGDLSEREKSMGRGIRRALVHLRDGVRDEVAELRLRVNALEDRVVALEARVEGRAIAARAVTPRRALPAPRQCGGGGDAQTSA